MIDAFRLINAQTVMLGQDPRQTTSVLGHLNRPSIQVWFDIEINMHQPEEMFTAFFLGRSVLIGFQGGV